MSKLIKIDNKINNFDKTITVSGDKSLSIRWVLFSSLAKGRSKAYNLLLSQDVLAAIDAVKKLGINVEETTLKSVKVIDGKVIISIEGTDLISVVDQGMLVDNAQDFIDPLTELSVNTKVYTAKALNRELVTPEFIEAAKSISISDKIEVIAQSSAVENLGATTEQSKAFATAKAEINKDVINANIDIFFINFLDFKLI